MPDPTIIINETTEVITVTVNEPQSLASVAVTEVAELVSVSITEPTYDVTAAITTTPQDVVAEITTTPQTVLAKVFNGGTVGTYQGRAGEPIPAYSPVREENGLLYTTHAGDLNLSHQTLGITMETGTTGNTVYVLLFGILDNGTWAWTPGEPLFLGADGSLTHSPGTVAYWQQVGRSLSPTRILVSIEEAVINAT